MTIRIVIGVILAYFIGYLIGILNNRMQINEIKKKIENIKILINSTQDEESEKNNG